MKTTTSYGITLLFLLAALFTACSDDDEVEPLKLYADYYEIPVSKDTTIPVQSGSGYYSFKVENTEIINAFAEECGTSAPSRMEMFFLSGKQKGETVLTVIDNVSKETATLRIKVVDDYLGFFLYAEAHSALSQVGTFYLINNTGKEAYFFGQTINDEGDFDRPLLQKGSYIFTEEDDKRYLTLNYAEDGGKLTDAAIAPTPHKFLIVHADELIYRSIEQSLAPDWSAGTSDTRTSPQTIEMTLVEVATGDGAVAQLQITGGMPENILP